MLTYKERKIDVGDVVHFQHKNYGIVRGTVKGFHVELNPWLPNDEPLFDVFIHVDDMLYMSSLIVPRTFKNITKMETWNFEVS